MMIQQAILDYREAVELKLPMHVKGTRLVKLQAAWDELPQPKLSWPKWYKETFGDKKGYKCRTRQIQFREASKGEPPQPKPKTTKQAELEYMLDRAIVNVERMAEGFGRYMTVAQRRAYYVTLRNRFQGMVEAVDRQSRGGNGPDTVEGENSNEAETHQQRRAI